MFTNNSFNTQKKQEKSEEKFARLKPLKDSLGQNKKKKWKKEQNKGHPVTWTKLFSYELKFLLRETTMIRNYVWPCFFIWKKKVIILCYPIWALKK